MTDFNTKDRKNLASKGAAFQGGKYPTPNLASLRDAVQAWGRSTPSERSSLKSYLQRRARALGAPQSLRDRISQLKV